MTYQIRCSFSSAKQVLWLQIELGREYVSL